MKNKEISFAELVSLIWKGKRVIITCLAISIMFACIYLTSAKTKKTAQAVIDIPSNKSIVSYSRVINTLNIINGRGVIEITDLQKSIFKDYSNLLKMQSYYLRKQNPPISFVVSDVHIGSSTALSVSLSCNCINVDAAKKSLENILSKQENVLINQVNSKLEDIVLLSKEKLINQSTLEEEKANFLKQNRIKEIQHAQKIAEENNISRPINVFSQFSNNNLPLLGKNILNSMLNNENSNPLPLDDGYYALTSSLDIINKINLSNVNVRAFHFAMKPIEQTTSLNKTRLKIFILAVIAGLASGIIILLSKVLINNINLFIK